MADEKPKEQTLSDFTGSVSEQRRQKASFIKTYGLAEFEKLVIRSCDPKYNPPKK